MLSASLNGEIIMWKVRADANSGEVQVKKEHKFSLDPPMPITILQYTAHDRRIWCGVLRLSFSTLISQLFLYSHLTSLALHFAFISRLFLYSHLTSLALHFAFISRLFLYSHLTSLALPFCFICFHHNIQRSSTSTPGVRESILVLSLENGALLRQISINAPTAAGKGNKSTKAADGTTANTTNRERIDCFCFSALNEQSDVSLIPLLVLFGLCLYLFQHLDAVRLVCTFSVMCIACASAVLPVDRTRLATAHHVLQRAQLRVPGCLRSARPERRTQRAQRHQQNRSLAEQGLLLPPRLFRPFREFKLNQAAFTLSNRGTVQLVLHDYAHSLYY